MTSDSVEFQRLLTLIQAGEFETACTVLDQLLVSDESLGKRVVALRDEAGRPLLCHVARRPGAAEVLERLLRLGADPNSTCGTDHVLCTVITSGSAAGLDTLAELETLLRHGANPDAIATGAGTLPVLHFAIRENRIQHARLLIKHGANPRLRARESGLTALDVAKRYGSNEAREMLIELDKSGES